MSKPDPHCGLARIDGKVTAEYGCWSNMKQRCMNQEHPAYKLYGKRGIKVCDRWLHGENGLSGFVCFLQDMGRKPSPKHTIDRHPNGDGDYHPRNCRWATAKDQISAQVKKKISTTLKDKHKNESPWQKRDKDGRWGTGI